MPNIFRNAGRLAPEKAVLIPGDLATARIIHADPSGEVFIEPSPEEKALEAAREALVAIQTEGEEIRQQAEQDRDNLLFQARREAEQLREEAWQEGYAAALTEKRSGIEGCISQVNSLLGVLQASMEDFLQGYEKELGNLALEIAEKVIEKRISEDDLVLTELVRRAVSDVKKADWIKVEVSDQLTGLVERLRKELSGSGTEMEVVGRKGLSVGACVIQTPDGVIDASVSTQLSNLREAFAEADAE